MAIDDVGIAGYVVFRNGAQVSTTHDPAFTDRGLQSLVRYQYAVAAFDAAGNVSSTSEPVAAVTLQVPDRSPPSVPAGLHSSGQSMNSIVLAWTASQDNVGVAGYEVYRNGGLIANVVLPSYTDVGLSPATSYTYRVRAFDTSDNASGDSNTMTVATAVLPDTTAPSVPSGVGATGTSPSEIDVSWTASTDNVGVTSYQVYRDGVQVADVVGTGFTDQGLAASTPYTYEVRASDAAGNHSGLSDSTTASTMAAPTTPPPTVDPTTPPPTQDPVPEIMSVTLHAIPGCLVTVEVTVTASAPMADVVLDFNVPGHMGGSELFTFTASDLSQTRVLATDGDGTVNGIATASAGDESDTTSWQACTP